MPAGPTPTPTGHGPTHGAVPPQSDPASSLPGHPDCVNNYRNAVAAADAKYNGAYDACATAADPPACRKAAFDIWSDEINDAIEAYHACMSAKGLIDP